MAIHVSLLFVGVISYAGMLPSSYAVDVDPCYHKTVIFFKILQFANFLDPEKKEIDLICVGDDPMVRSIESMAPAYRSSGKQLVVRKTDSLAGFKQIEHGEIVFISGEERAQLAQILDEAARRKLLSVSDGEGFAERGVHIGIQILNNKVTFAINRSEVEKSGLYLSSRLYKLARIIE